MSSFAANNLSKRTRQRSFILLPAFLVALIGSVIVPFRDKVNSGVGDASALSFDLATTTKNVTQGSNTLVLVDARKVTNSALTLQAILSGLQAASSGPLASRILPTEQAVDDFCFGGNVTCWGGIVLYDSAVAGGWNYSLRFPDSVIPKTHSLVDVHKGAGAFVDNGIASLQASLDRILLNASASTGIADAATLQRWTSASLLVAQTATLTEADAVGPIYDFIAGIGSVFFLLGFLSQVFWIANGLAMEREMKVKDSMVMMGLQTWVYYLSWILVLGGLCAPTYAGMAVVMKYLVFPSSDLATVLALIAVSGIELLAFAMLISTFFSKARLAGVAANTITFAIGVVGGFIAGVPPGASFRIAFSILFPPTTMIFGTVVLARAEQYGSPVGVSQWNVVNAQQGISFAGVLISGLIGAILHGWVALLLDAHAGFVADPVGFVKTRLFGRLLADEESVGGGHVRGGWFEGGSVAGATVSMRIMGLTKQYKGAVMKSVDNLGLDLYEGEVLALLGKNGCGKSTTIGMLSGIVKPTSGDATIYGRSVLTDMHRIRESLGVCPQHDILWEQLTVRQTLRIFAGIKGVPVSQTRAEVNRWLQEIGIPEKADQRVSTLSGGQKRKVSICIAFMGGSKVVLIDEPSAGVDPLSRRAMWRVISNNKAGRTIIMTTHFLDEADLLGDRVAIMDLGKLKASGTALFLKRQLGVGYHLTLSLTPGAYANQEVADGLQAYIRRIAGADAKVASIGETEVVVDLPTGANAVMPALLRSLEAEPSLRVGAYDLAMVTLDDVFLRIVNDVDDDSYHDDRTYVTDDDGQNDFNGIPLGPLASRISRSDRDKHLPGKPRDVSSGLVEAGTPTFGAQYIALLRKRVLLALRDLHTFLFPTLLVILASVYCAIAFRTANVAVCVQLDHQTFDPIPVTDMWALGSGGAGGTNFTIAVDATTYATLQPVAPPRGGVNNVSLTTLDGVQALKDEFNNDFEDFKRVAAGLWFNATIFNPPSITAAYDVTRNFSTPMALNLLANAIWYKSAAGAGMAAAGPLITVSARPFPAAVDVAEGNFETQGNVLTALFFGYTLALCVMAVPGLIKEKELRVKDQQRFSGVTLASYWLSNLTWDMVQVAVMSLAIACSLSSLKVWTPSFGLTFIASLSYGLAMSQFSALFSLMFTTPSRGLMTLLGYTIVVAYFGITTYETAQLDKNPSVSAENTISAAFSILDPAFSYLQIMSYGTNLFYFQCTDNFDLDPHMFLPSGGVSSWFSSTLWGKYVVILFLQSILFSLILVLSESWDKLKLKLRQSTNGNGSTISPKWMGQGGVKDPEVEEEERLIAAGQSGMLCVKGLRKVYKGGKVAVDNLSLRIKENECFILLGSNGAGKTTTLKMVCGQHFPTAGEITVAGHSLLRDLTAVQRSIGVCPQFDSLWPTLTPREHLHLYAAIRGIPSHQRTFAVNHLLDALTLGPHADKRSAALSGGNRRKLSLGIAVIGSPKVLILDEPSTGMDPASKRAMWDVVLALRETLSVVLTTHSMEEAEALASAHNGLGASRIGIMVGGKLSTLGTRAALRGRHGKAFQVQVATGSADGAQRVGARMTEAFGAGCRVLESHLGSVRLEVDTMEGRVGLPAVFEYLESLRSECGIVDYQVGQTTLEQIFIRLAGADEGQENAFARKRKRCCCCC
ncbi:hypothetical protein HK101_010578 [Irineochytrium annulatum]|nr:hypothetical protein HK101_010578 [Irineochytrium annulatum]